MKIQLNKWWSSPWQKCFACLAPPRCSIEKQSLKQRFVRRLRAAGINLFCWIFLWGDASSAMFLRKMKMNDNGLVWWEQQGYRDLSHSWSYLTYFFAHALIPLHGISVIPTHLTWCAHIVALNLQKESLSRAPMAMRLGLQEKYSSTTTKNAILCHDHPELDGINMNKHDFLIIYGQLNGTCRRDQIPEHVAVTAERIRWTYIVEAWHLGRIGSCEKGAVFTHFPVFQGKTLKLSISKS